MTDIVIINECDQRHATLRSRLHESAIKVAPHVTELTGMPLPPTVNIRLTTPAKAAERIVANSKKTFDTVEGLSEEEATIAKLAFGFGSFVGSAFTRTMWPLIGGMATGDAEVTDVLVFPETIRDSAVSEEGIDAIVSHELTHAAQHARFPDFTTQRLRAMFTQNPDFKGKGTGISGLIEGHATWAHYRVTSRLHGRRVTNFATCTTTHAKLLKKVVGPLTRVLMDPATYTQGQEFIAALHHHGGNALVHRLWEEPALLPTKNDIRHPDMWLYRNQITAS